MRSWSFARALFVLAFLFHEADAQINFAMDSLSGIYSNGLGYLYNMVDQFLEVVQPSGGITFAEAFHENLFPDLLKFLSNSSSRGDISTTAQMFATDALKVLLALPGIATCAIIGFLYIIGMCLACLIFSCCRKRGCCGGKISKKPVQKSDKIKRPILSVLIFAVTTMIAAGLACTLVSDVAIMNIIAADKNTNEVPIINAAMDILQSASALIKRYIKDASSLSDVLRETVKATFFEFKGFANELLRMKNDSVLNTALRSIANLTTAAGRMNETLTTINQTTHDLQVLQRNLNATLVHISGAILSNTRGCSTCSNVDESAIALTKATPDFSQVPDVSKALKNLHDILNNSAVTSFDKKLDDFANITNETVTFLQNMTSELLNFTQLIDNLLEHKDVDTLMAPLIEFLANSTSFFSKPLQGSFTISQYVLLALAGYGVTIFLVVICNLGGILTGLCCKRPTSKTSGSCSSKKASETFFVGSATGSFSFGCATMIIVLFLFLLTAPIYTELCRDKENYDSARYMSIDNMTRALINYLSETGTLPATWTPTANVTINVYQLLSRLSIATLLRECQNNASVLTLIIDIVTVDELKRIANDLIDAKINSILADLRDRLNETLSGLADALVSNSTLASLNDAMSSVPDKVNFSAVIEQFRNVSQLNSTLQNTANEADKASSSSGNDLHVQAERLRSAAVEYVTPLTQKTDHLNKSLEELVNSSFKSQISSTLRSLEAVKTYISNNKSQIIDSTLTMVKDFIKEQVPEVIDVLKLDGFFECRYLYDVINGAFQLLCDLLQLLKALWFSYGWCMFFFIPSIIFGLWLGGLNARQLNPSSSDKEKGDPASNDKGRETADGYNSREERPYSDPYFNRGPRGMPPPRYPGYNSREERPYSDPYFDSGPRGKPPPRYPGYNSREERPYSDPYFNRGPRGMPPPRYPGYNSRQERPYGNPYFERGKPPPRYPGSYGRGFRPLPPQHEMDLRFLPPAGSPNPYDRELQPAAATSQGIFYKRPRPVSTNYLSPFQ